MKKICPQDTTTMIVGIELDQANICGDSSIEGLSRSAFLKSICTGLLGKHGFVQTQEFQF
ncbi:hypothetical protein MUK42_37289 [Musa troglodytarum]|uniref:Uncharacterized protein n=1 Tax=Musa troglodytarum TaxID=320322 RepID=A0A9E7J9M4_9LILI|nr:hypothetical protein MUK42_37289 [Musa troglodytarum]